MKVSLCFIAALVFSLFLSGLVIGAPPDGLVFLMNFDEGSGDTVHDQSGFGNDGEIDGKIDWVDGKFDGALNLDGATHVTVPNAEPLSALTHPMSVGLWINPAIVGGWRSIVEMDGAAGWKIGLHTTGNVIVWTTYHVLDFGAVTPVEAGDWVHIAATWDGAEALMYLNGELDAAVAGGGVIDVANEPSLDIGFRSTSQSSWYEGLIDDVFIFNRAVEQEEIQDFIAKGSKDILAVEPVGKAATTWGALKL
jgi:concanavalin A-like lectin/glucanase superfamily protein